MTFIWQRVEPVVLTGLCIGAAAIGLAGLVVFGGIAVVGAVQRAFNEFRDAQVGMYEEQGATMFEGDEMKRWS